MAYEAKILQDSLSPDNIRLTTFEITFPRFVLAELNTHRMLSRNSASSRAIPVHKYIKQVEEDPFIPETFTKNQKGMVGYDFLNEDDSEFAYRIWKGACQDAIDNARRLEQLEVHKALANRILEPFKWHTAIITATEWDNFFNLRTDENAQPEIRKIALMMRDLYNNSEPLFLSWNQWHLPLVSDKEILEGPAAMEPGQPEPIRWYYWKKVSVGRCARVSYLTHDGIRDPDKDVELHDRLKENGHLSPFEHVATPISKWGSDQEKSGWCANFRGWYQYRRSIPNEHDFLGAK